MLEQEPASAPQGGGEASCPGRQCLFKIVENNYFDVLSMTVIVLNLVFSIALTNTFAAVGFKGFSPGWIHAERCFTAYYTVEVSIKIYAYSWSFFTNKDMFWNIWDLLITLTSLVMTIVEIVERTPGNPKFLFLRGIRLCKTARLLHAPQTFWLKELHLMMLCMIKAFGTFFWTFVFMIGVALISSLYFVVAMGHYLIDHPGSDEEDTIRSYFGNVVEGMLVFIKGAAGGAPWGTFLDVVELSGRFNSLIFLFLIIYLRFSFLGIITSIFVEKAKSMAYSDESVMARDRMAHTTRVQRLRKIFDKIDANRSGRISVEELEGVRHDHVVMEQLGHEGVTDNDMGLFLETLASLEEAGDLKLATFVDACVKVRGNASSMDIQALKMQLQGVMAELMKQIKIVHKDLDSQAQLLKR